MVFILFPGSITEDPHLLRNTGKRQRTRAELRNWWIIEMEALSYLHVLGWLFVSLMLK